MRSAQLLTCVHQSNINYSFVTNKIKSKRHTQSV